jgi:hypothetical protein
MQLSGRDLQGLANRPAPLPAPVEPRLPLVEEVVLLSLDCSRVVKHNAARLATQGHPDGPGDYHAAVTALAERGMLTHTGPLRKPVADPSARISARQARVASIIQRPAPPQGADAELLVLLAAARALTLESAADHMKAHTRIASIGQSATTIPPVVSALARELGTDTMRELADRLLPATRKDLHGADFAGRSNLSAALTYGPGAFT